MIAACSVSYSRSAVVSMSVVKRLQVGVEMMDVWRETPTKPLPLLPLSLSQTPLVQG